MNDQQEQLAALLHELVERQQGEHLEPAQPDDQGRCTVCLKRADWLIAHGVTVGPASPVRPDYKSVRQVMREKGYPEMDDKQFHTDDVAAAPFADDAQSPVRDPASPELDALIQRAIGDNRLFARSLTDACQFCGRKPPRVSG